NSIKSVPNNTLVVLRHKLYENDAIFANQSKDLFFETVNIYSAPGMGIRAYTCDNLYFNRFSTKLKPNTDRLMTVTADAIHTIDCKGDLKITNSIFENRGDDAVNTHGMYLKIGEKLAGNKIFAYNPRGYHFAPEVGDTVEVSRRSDLTVVQTLTVKSVALDEGGDGYIVEFKENLSGDVVASKDINDGDVICNPSRSTKLIFQNNIVRNSRCRGILIQTREALVENNTFANMSDAAILITSDTGAWYESLPSQNVTIRNNKIIGNNRSLSGSQGDITAICFGSDNSLGATGLQKNFEISNNFIANGKRAGIFLNSISGVNISHNLIHNVGSKANIAMYDTALGFSNAKDVVINKNTINPNSGSTFKPVYIGTGAETDTFTVTDNVGLTINDVIPSIKQASKVGKTTATINFDDKSLLDWTSVGTIVAMVGKTDVDQEIVVPTEKDFNNWLKMAWKDDGIYYAYSVTDDELVFNDTAQYWFGDGVEMFITTNTTSQSSMGTIKVTEPSCAQLFMSPSKTGCIISEARTSDEVLANKNLIKMKSWLKADNSGYEGEGFIPFNAIPNLKNAVETGSEVSFCVNFFDVDKTGKQISVSNADAPVENNKYVPGRMPKIKFVTEG
ncbi:MAG: right-handed parallel beta-helix repeat-containing protein, partial [Clostridia bacterium]